MENILGVLWLPSHVMMDTPYLDPAQALVRPQESGINKVQVAKVKVMKFVMVSHYCLVVIFFSPLE